MGSARRPGRGRRSPTRCRSRPQARRQAGSRVPGAPGRDGAARSHRSVRPGGTLLHFAPSPGVKARCRSRPCHGRKSPVGLDDHAPLPARGDRGGLPQLRAADYPPLLEYVERLSRYPARQRIGRDEALARITDLWRCHPPSSLELETGGQQWRVQIGSTPHEEWMVVDGKTGAMRIDAPGRERAARKGRH